MHAVVKVLTLHHLPSDALQQLDATLKLAVARAPVVRQSDAETAYWGRLRESVCALRDPVITANRRAFAAQRAPGATV
jgi:hypothetical protein